MCNVRPRFLPGLPRLSNFMELNVRTYVHDEAGVPGVWFYSLDANQPLAVKIARRFFHLPYEHAAMESSRAKSGAIRYRSTRAGSAKPTVFEYAPGAELPAAAIGSLEFFLIERYRLYANANGRLRRGAVFHEPYPLCEAEVTAWDDHLFALDGFTPTGRAPDHLIMSRGVDVTDFSPRGSTSGEVTVKIQTEWPTASSSPAGADQVRHVWRRLYPEHPDDPRRHHVPPLRPRGRRVGLDPGDHHRARGEVDHDPDRALGLGSGDEYAGAGAAAPIT